MLPTQQYLNLAHTNQIMTNKNSFLYLATMPRAFKQGTLLTIDITLLLFAAWAAYAIRLGEWFIPNFWQALLMAIAPLLALPIFAKNGLYRSVIRYVGEQALWAILQGMTLAALLWASIAFLTQLTGLGGVPRSVPFLYWMLGVMLIGGARFAARWLLWLPLRQRFDGRQVLIYGAGNAGRQLAASLREGREFFPAGFLDDDTSLHGKDIAGLRVYAPSQLQMLLERFDIHDVIVTLPAATQAQRKKVMAFLEKHGVKVRILPAMNDIASGRHLVSSLREVDISDLLGRDSVEAAPDLLGVCITGKSVLVTGAGGSIGSELCRQIVALSPSRLVLLEANEYALYQINRMLSQKTRCTVIPCLGSVKDGDFVSRLLLEHGVQTVYHAAAHKHVPLVESNVIEGVINNVIGTQRVAEAALVAGVETFVLISTDKAVRSTNVMGATKRWAELIVQDCAKRAIDLGSGQRFCAVRFGNVLGSSGSVIPLFKEQIAQGGPVTVTHPEVTRYFMAIHEAVELVIQAGSLSHGGEVFLLDMGEPVKILDLARNMIMLAGRTIRDQNTPDGDIEIVLTGLRPGEKLYEELLIADGNAEGTLHPKIMKADEPILSDLALRMQHLEQGIAAYDIEIVRKILMQTATNSTAIDYASSAVIIPISARTIAH